MPSKRIAVDLGASSVRALEVQKSGDGVQVTAGGRLTFRAAPGLPADKLRVLQERALEKVMEKAGIGGKSVVAGVSGQSAFIRNIKLPPIPESRVDQIVRYEVQQTIPFRLDEIAVDYQLLQQDSAPEMEVVLVAMKGDVCEQFIDHLKAAKVRPVLIEANPLAIYNAYVYNGYSNEADCTAILDFGATTTTILIEYDGQLRFTRCVGLGGNDISQLLANEFGKSFDEAELIKMQAGLLFPPPGPNAKVSDEHRKISAVLTRAIDRLLGEVKLSIGYFRTQSGAVAVSRAFICGGGAQMRNLRPLIADRLGVQVEFLNPFRKVEVAGELADLKRQGLEFVTALGHGLRGLAPCAIEISLEPPRLAARRKRRIEAACYAGSLVFLIGATFFAGRLLTPDLEADKQKLAKYEEALSPFDAVDDKRQELATEKGILNEQYLLLKNSAKPGIPLLLIMEMLSDAMDPAVFVESIKTEKPPGRDTRRLIVVTGYADAGNVDENYSKIFEMSQALEAVCTGKVTLERKEIEGGKGRVQFTLRLDGYPPGRNTYIERREKYVASQQAPPAAAPAAESA